MIFFNFKIRICIKWCKGPRYRANYLSFFLLFRQKQRIYTITPTQFKDQLSAFAINRSSYSNFSSSKKTPRHRGTKSLPGLNCIPARLISIQKFVQDQCANRYFLDILFYFTSIFFFGSDFKSFPMQEILLER